VETTSLKQKHEAPFLGELSTITGGFSGGGSSASKRKRYVRAVMCLYERVLDRSTKLSLCFIRADLEDVFPDEDYPVVISIIIVRRKVNRVLIDQGSSVDVMFWRTFTNLQISPHQLKPYDGCLVGFIGNQVEV